MSGPPICSSGQGRGRGWLPRRAWFTHAQALPDGLIRARPALAVWYAYALLGRGDLEAAGTYLADAERLLATASSPAGQAPPSSGPVEPEELRSLLARIAVARGYLAQARGDTAATVAHARRALGWCPTRSLRAATRRRPCWA